MLKDTIEKSHRQLHRLSVKLITDLRSLLSGVQTKPQILFSICIFFITPSFPQSFWQAASNLMLLTPRLRSSLCSRGTWTRSHRWLTRALLFAAVGMGVLVAVVGVVVVRVTFCVYSPARCACSSLTMCEGCVLHRRACCCLLAPLCMCQSRTWSCCCCIVQNQTKTKPQLC
jgi:hypothetical protein